MGINDIAAAQQHAEKKQNLQSQLHKLYSDLNRRFFATWPKLQEAVESSPDLQDINLEWIVHNTSGFSGYLTLPGVGDALYILELPWQVKVDDNLNATLAIEESGRFHRYVYTTNVQSPALPLKICLEKVLLERYKDLRRLHKSRGYDVDVRVADFCFFWSGDSDTPRIAAALVAVLKGEIPADDFRMIKTSHKGACFVASVVYGESAAEVEVLRTFIDKYLVGSRCGRLLLAYYYSVSPRVAMAIDKSRTLKVVTHSALTLVIGVLRLLIPAIRREEVSKDRVERADVQPGHAGDGYRCP